MISEKYVATLQQIKAIVDEALREASSAPSPKRRAQPEAPRRLGHTTQLSFETNILAFMNKHAKGLKGPQKFTLLLARVLKGSTTGEVSYQDIKAQWNKMRTVLGGPFNPVHGNRAKAKGWVDSEKHGMYKITRAWKDALA